MIEKIIYKKKLLALIVRGKYRSKKGITFFTPNNFTQQFGYIKHKKKYLINPQWLRNIKDRKYHFFRIDTFFSKVKYTNVKIFNNGGWHFTNIKTAKEIEYKLKSYLHHREFDMDPLTINQIDEIINNKKAIYNLNVDKSVSKIGNGNNLEKFDFKKLPKYIQNNREKFKEWID